MSLFATEILSVQRDIKKFGQLVKVREPSEGTLADPNKPWDKTAGTPVDTETYMCFFNEKRKDHEPQIREYESLIGDGLLYALMPYVQGLAITLKHVIIRGNQTYKIRYVRPLNVNGEEIFTKIGIRE